jgi:polyisoprenyl-phosphate glycosyltransferase
MNENKIIIDLDNTITLDSFEKNYENKELNKDVSEAIDNASENHGITIFTARNMLSLNGDIDKINQITKPIAKDWLKKNNVRYEKIIFGKPYCGSNGLYIDDKNASIEEFVFRFNGPYRKKTVDVVIPFYNEEKNILEVYTDVKRLERLFDIKNFIFVDNGSSDGSNIIFEKLKDRDKKIRIIRIKKNIGYGFGMKTGLASSTADFAILNHSDCQFDTFSYFLTHLKTISKIDNFQTIFSQRINRPLSDRIISYLLRVILTVIKLKKIKEFNGQPKLIDLNDINGNIEKLPNDFAFDFAVYNLVSPKFFLPVIQKSRLLGNSSWSGSLFNSVKVFKMYLKESLKK